MSIARQHKAKVQADIKDGKVVVGNTPAANAVKGLAGAKKAGDLMLVALEDDLATLSTIDNLAERAQRKKTMLPKYLDYIASYQASGARHPNPVLVRVIIWLLDVEKIDAALALADLAIEQQQLMPERFKRDLPCFVIEMVVDWAERQNKENHSAEPYLSEVVQRVLSKKWLISEPIIGGKLFKQAGINAELVGDDKSAIGHYETAMAVNERAGVKTRLDNARKRLVNSATGEESAAGQDSPTQ